MDALTTSFGTIRPWRESDAEALVKYANNRKIWANLRDGFHHPYLKEHARAFLEAVSRQNPTTFFAIATLEEAIGSIGLSFGQDVHRLTAEMGYWLAEPYWGQGIMSEAVARFSDGAFAAFDLVRIYAEPYATNTNSCRILEKAGFVLEGRLRSSVIKDGKILDQLMYGRTKSGT
ncbi:MAG: GNAT family N-acetyltransferase [Anaerolineaceae bacterium]